MLEPLFNEVADLQNLNTAKFFNRGSARVV